MRHLIAIAVLVNSSVIARVMLASRDEVFANCITSSAPATWTAWHYPGGCWDAASKTVWIDAQDCDVWSILRHEEAHAFGRPDGEVEATFKPVCGLRA